MKTALNVGDYLCSVTGPADMEGSCFNIEVGSHRVDQIRVGVLDGPMGKYHVAEVYVDGELSSVHPLHLMESIRVDEPC